METSSALDSINDTPPLPELSFDDLLDDSPVKVDQGSTDDPLELEHTHKGHEDTLHTPGPKKTPHTITSATQIAPTTTVEEKKKTTSSVASTLTPTTTPKQTATTVAAEQKSPSTAKTAEPAEAAVTLKPALAPVLLNNKNILPRTSALSNQFLKISPKSTTAANKMSTATATTTTAMAGKTAVKTANGQIIYIQKTTGMPGVRLQQTVLPTTTTTAASVTASSAAAVTNAVIPTTTTTTSGNKTVAIQVLRSADGKLVPLKGATASGIVATKSALTLSPTMATQLAGKKIISTSGGHVVIKAPLKSFSNVTVSGNVTGTTTAVAAGKQGNKGVQIENIASTQAATTTATSTSTSAIVTSATTTTSGGKIVVQSANGKQIVVSNQHLIKLSPKSAAATTVTSSSIPTTTAGQLQAIKIPGKPGLQYVRVFPNSKINRNVTATTTTSAASTGTSAVSNTTASTNAATSNNATATTSTSAVKILNSMPQKLTLVRPNATTKFVLTQSPKKDINTPVTFSPVTTKVQKTIVTVPTLRAIGDGKGSSIASTSTTSTLTNSPSSSSSAQSPLKTSAASGDTELSPVPKISKINSIIKRMTAVSEPDDANNEPLAKKTASGSRILVMSRSMLRTNMPPLQPRPGLVQHVTLQNSVLKSNNVADASVAIKNPNEIKSLMICEKAQAQLRSQQQQQQQQQQQHKLQQQTQPIRLPPPPPLMKIKQEPLDDDVQSTLEEGAGPLRRKHCNCSKSQCLKLYCDCFANGEFCQNCTCKDCFNNLQYEDERQRAIKSCLERNPRAFKPKITTVTDQGDMRLHNKGCNCRRSGCLKNYCECYEAKIPCSSNCKCVGCRNIEDRPDLDMDPIDTKILATIANSSGSGAAGLKRSYDKSNKSSDKMLRETAKALAINSDLISSSSSGSGSNGASGGPPPEKQQCNFITQEVIDATIQCMISQADECEKNGLPAYQMEKMVMEELGRCLVEIIDFSIRNTDTSYSQE